mmetsp:Transcript_1815/g.7278  ORF Transcript_1815/g.7278 Transcript_1815/m.7278 type:complete len:203 (-) Transcript_1815:823-1431(-)
MCTRPEPVAPAMCGMQGWNAQRLGTAESSALSYEPTQAALAASHSMKFLRSAPHMMPSPAGENCARKGTRYCPVLQLCRTRTLSCQPAAAAVLSFLPLALAFDDAPVGAYTRRTLSHEVVRRRLLPSGAHTALWQPLPSVIVQIGLTVAPLLPGSARRSQMELSLALPDVELASRWPSPRSTSMVLTLPEAICSALSSPPKM